MIDAFTLHMGDCLDPTTGDMNTTTKTANRMREFPFAVTIEARDGFRGLPRVIAECSDRVSAEGVRASRSYINSHRAVVKVIDRSVWGM